MIEINDLKVGYTSVLIQIEKLNLSAGSVYALIGANGSGKTTFLNTFIGSGSLLSGSLLIDQKQIEDYPKRDLAKKIAYVSSKFDGIEFLTVKEYISLGRAPFTNAFGRLTPRDLAFVETALVTLDLTDFKDRFTTELSDGERQLAAVARALSQNTSIIIMDEPTAFLDYGNRKKLVRLLVEIAKKMDKCIILSTHDIDLCVEENLKLLVIDQQSKSLQEYSTLSKSEILKSGFNYIL